MLGIIHSREFFRGTSNEFVLIVCNPKTSLRMEDSSSCEALVPRMALVPEKRAFIYRLKLGPIARIRFINPKEE